MCIQTLHFHSVYLGAGLFKITVMASATVLLTLGSHYERLFMNDRDVGVYCRPEIGNRILIGSVEPSCDVIQYLDDAATACPGLTEGMHTVRFV